ncbi:MAG TPA: hypothetical protein VFC26_04935 [Verrucomicrobiae bacterium]|nr:hypothetical protein [Verrucomicrobiae bacterium]
MFSRIIFVLIAAFFILMNVLLWRAEIANRNKPGAPVPIENVWRRMITAPNSSTLEIQHHGEKIGLLHWIPSVAEAARKDKMAPIEMPEGMVRFPVSFDIDCNGSVFLTPEQRLRFNFDLKLSTNYSWQEFALRLNIRPALWEVLSIASNETVVFNMDDGHQRTERTWAFKDFRRPERILRDVAGPVLPGLISMIGGPLNLNEVTQVATRLHWEARNERLLMGNARVRVYRLQLRLLDGYEVKILVSQIGEVLRVDLPDEIVLIHEDLIQRQE